MAESKSDPSITISDKGVKTHNRHHNESHGLRNDIDEDTPMNDVKAPNVFERMQEEIEALVQTIHPKKETKTSNDSVLNKTETRFGNTCFPWVKIELQVVDFDFLLFFMINCGDETINAESKPEKLDSVSQEKDAKAPNLIERAKEELEAIMQKVKSPRHHHKETHGTSDDINENTPISEVKGPNVFERAKEEIEALVQTIHPKKESDDNVVHSPKKEGGFRMSVGKGLEKVCSPWGHKRD